MTNQEFLDKYLVDRHGTGCTKWDGLEEKYGNANLVGMGIADMEFSVCDAIKEKLTERVSHGVFGYSFVPDSYYDAFCGWMERRHNYKIKKEWIRFSTGCVTGIAWSIAAFTKVGDACMVLSPVYYPFYNVVTNNDRKLVAVEMKYDHGSFTMDYDAIEKAIVDNDVKLFAQCSPQNPSGRVWTEEELDCVLSICQKHNVLVVSDEIHQDIIPGDRTFIPAATVSGGKYSDIVITLNSATKVFNIATLLHSHIIISNDELRKTYDHFASGMNRTEVSIMGMIATQAGYTDGEEWVDAMVSVVRSNYEDMKEILAKNLPEAVVCPLEGTYLTFIDLRAYLKPEDMIPVVQDECRLAVDYGDWFGEKYQGFIRINLATDPKYVRYAAESLSKACLARANQAN